MYIYSLPKTFDGPNQHHGGPAYGSPASCFWEYLLDLSHADCWSLKSTLAELGICLCTEQGRWIFFPISYFWLTLGVCEYCSTIDLNDESITYFFRSQLWVEGAAYLRVKTLPLCTMLGAQLPCSSLDALWGWIWWMWVTGSSLSICVYVWDSPHSDSL